MSDKKTTLAVADGHIHIDDFQADVWLSIGVPGASVHVVITPDEARALIAALELVIA
jgi:hypothetical protein